MRIEDEVSCGQASEQLPLLEQPLALYRANAQCGARVRMLRSAMLAWSETGLDLLRADQCRRIDRLILQRLCRYEQAAT